MDSNLLREYDQVVEYLQKEYFDSFGAIGQTQAYKNVFKQMGFTDAIKLYLSINILNSGFPESFRNRLEEVATDEEKQEPFFQLVVNEYPMDYFASNILQKFPMTDFAKLKKINDL